MTNQTLQQYEVSGPEREREGGREGECEGERAATDVKTRNNGGTSRRRRHSLERRCRHRRLHVWPGRLHLSSSPLNGPTLIQRRTGDGPTLDPLLARLPSSATAGRPASGLSALSLSQRREAQVSLSLSLSLFLSRAF